MDRSFLAFRQFLARLIAGTEAPKPDAKTRSATPGKPNADAQDGWARIEL